MADSFDRDGRLSQAIPVEQLDGDRSTSVDQPFLEVLRNSAKDQNYTLDALQAEMGKDRSYIDKVLKGEKPMPDGFIDAMPDEVEDEAYARKLEARGHVVVRRSELIEHKRHLLIGLVGEFCGLPRRAAGMVKAALPTKARRRA